MKRYHAEERSAQSNCFVFTSRFPIPASSLLLPGWPGSFFFVRSTSVGLIDASRRYREAVGEVRFVNIGAVGTFVVREAVSESALRTAIARKLPFKCEIMICPARDIRQLTSRDPFARQPTGTDIIRFVSVSAKRPRALPPLPLSLPSDEDWLLKIIAIQGRFVLGLYRRR